MALSTAPENGMPAAPEGFGHTGADTGQRGGAIVPSSGAPQVRRALPLALGYVLCALGGVLAPSSSLGASLLVGFGMVVVSSGRPVSTRALGILAAVVPAAVLGMMAGSSIASSVVTCGVAAALAILACERKATSGALCALVAAGTLLQLGADALLALCQGTTLVAGINTVLEECLEQFGAAYSATSDTLDLVRQLMRLVWPVSYVTSALLALLFACLGVKLASSRVGEGKPELQKFTEFDLPLWTVAVFVGSVVCVAVALTVSAGWADVLLMVGANVILAVRFAIAAQGLSVLFWLLDQKGANRVATALFVLVALVLELQFIVMSLVGLVDVWFNFRCLQRGVSSDVQENARHD